MESTSCRHFASQTVEDESDARPGVEVGGIATEISLDVIGQSSGLSRGAKKVARKVVKAAKKAVVKRAKKTAATPPAVPVATE